MLWGVDYRNDFMKRHSLVVARAFAVAAALAVLAGPVAGEDLLQVYREAQKQDPSIASARSLWEATQERVPQARASRNRSWTWCRLARWPPP